MIKQQLKAAIFGIFSIPLLVFGQGGNPGNLRTPPFQFLGWNAGVPGDLQIRNDFAVPAGRILFFTGSPLNERMRINNFETSATTAAAGAVEKDGFVGINRLDPWSRLHLQSAVTGQVNFGGYRPWMREGILWQSSTDQLWFGHRRWTTGPQIDQQNAVINWGDDHGACIS